MKKLSMYVMCLATIMLGSTTVSHGAPATQTAEISVDAAAQEQAGELEVYPLLEEPVLVMGVTDDGFRPLHLSIYGRYAAITAAKNGASRIYLYDTKTQELKLIGDDAKTGIQIVWGHLHYKSGQVAVNDKYVAYARESGAIDQEEIMSFMENMGLNRAEMSVQLANLFQKYLLQF